MHVYTVIVCTVLVNKYYEVAVTSTYLSSIQLSQEQINSFKLYVFMFDLGVSEWYAISNRIQTVPVPAGRVVNIILAPLPSRLCL